MSTQIKVTGNKLVRITENDIKVGLHRILKDGNTFLQASGVLTPIVWNNIIGANFDDKEQHSEYCKRMNVTSGQYSFVSEHNAYQAKPFTEIDSCTIKVN